MSSESAIKLFHAHVYFDGDALDAAEALCTETSKKFDLKMGRMHKDPVGPHPRGSCQLTVPTNKFAETISWLMMHRGDHTVFVHAITGDDLKDHTQGVMWLGESEALNLDIFTKKADA